MKVKVEEEVQEKEAIEGIDSSLLCVVYLHACVICFALVI